MINERKQSGEVTAAVPSLPWTYESTSDMLHTLGDFDDWRTQMRKEHDLADLKRVCVPQSPNRRKSLC